MSRTYTNQRYLDALKDRVLIFDGAMGTNLQSQNLGAEHFGGEKYNGCNDYLVLTYPAAVERIHRSFLEVGVDVIETNTFRANRITLGEYGLAERTVEINRAAATLARKLADEYSTEEQPRFVAGSIGPSGKLPSADDPDLSDVNFDDLRGVFFEQSLGLIEGGVDLLLIETSQDILEVKSAIHGILAAFLETGISLPIQAQVTLDTTGRMLLGTDIQAALAILEGMSIDVIGLNCSTGPEHMRAPLSYLGEYATLPVSAIPNAGLPLNVDGEAIYPLEPEPFAEAMAEFILKDNINVVGGCCGTTPAHLKQLVEKVHGLPSPPRPKKPIQSLASGVHSVSLKQEPPPFIIGERCNAQGSRKFKRLLLAEDWDAITEIARSQVEYGSHALDISVAVTENPDEAEMMRTAVKKLTTAVPVPLVIDTTEPDVLETALKTAPGRCMLNSTHLESGREKADQVFALVKEHNATVLVLTIDEEGMAKTAERKLAVAKRIFDIAVNDHGLNPGDLIFDALTFTLATGDPEFADSAQETIAGIRQIKKELPGVYTSLGVSNLSFGLSSHSRPVLNSVFLYHCVKSGLDMAIINPAHITSYSGIPENERVLAEDLIFNRRPDALQRYITYFEGLEPSSEVAEVDIADQMTAAERLYWRVVNRHKEGVESDIDELIVGLSATSHGAIKNGGDDHSIKIKSSSEKEGREVDFRETPPLQGGLEMEGPSQHQAAVEVLNQVLLPAMKEVGDRFGAGELILPFVLQSAEVMKKAVNHLETYLQVQEGLSKGTVVLATVYGDVHDIGKNLVKTILSNNGFKVIDLGKQVPAETIINTAVENQADAIGLSALLVSTSKQMSLILNELNRRGLEFPVLLGGAAINRRFGRRINKLDNGEIYSSGAFYCKDAFEGLDTMENLIDPGKRRVLYKNLQIEVERELNLERKADGVVQRSRSSIQPLPISFPDRMGPRSVFQMPLEIVFQYLSKNELFRLSWGAKNTRGEEWKTLQAEFEARLALMQKEALREGWLKPQGVYGYWPCQADKDELIIYSPESTLKSLHTLHHFQFPRQSSGDHLCLSDYFAPKGSEQLDLVAFQVVTVGKEATERFDALQNSGNYMDAYYVHGLAVQTAEATAEYLHRHIRRELNLSEGQGKRYSWGYPAIPELNDHRKVFDLLPAETSLGMTLTSAYQLVPEQSTAAIIVHHPGASYFNIGESRVDQLLKGR